MADKKKKADIGLLLHVEQDREFFHINLRAVVLNTESTGSIRNPASGAWESQYRGEPMYLGNLQIHSQGESRTFGGTVNTDRRLYGFNVIFSQPYSVGLAEAAAMAKTLTRIDRKLRKLQDGRGDVQSYGEYVTRVAEAIGAKTIIEATTDRGWSYSENDHRTMTLAEGRARIDQIERNWKDEAKPAEVAEV